MEPRWYDRDYFIAASYMRRPYLNFNDQAKNADFFCEILVYIYKTLIKEGCSRYTVTQKNEQLALATLATPSIGADKPRPGNGSDLSFHGTATEAVSREIVL